MGNQYCIYWEKSFLENFQGKQNEIAQEIFSPVTSLVLDGLLNEYFSQLTFHQNGGKMKDLYFKLL